MVTAIKYIQLQKKNLFLAPLSYNVTYLPPTFPLYREVQDHAVGQRPAQQRQDSGHQTKRPE